MSIRKQKLEASLEGLFSGSKTRSAQTKASPSSEESVSSTEVKSRQFENVPLTVSDEGSLQEDGVFSSMPMEVESSKESYREPTSASQVDRSVVKAAEDSLAKKSPHAPLTVQEEKAVTPVVPSTIKTAIQASEAAKSEIIVQEIEETVQIVTFRVGKNYYGININAVQTIIKPESACPVPFTPEYVLGLINLRGQIVPVIDLRKRLGLEAVEETKDTRIVIVAIRNEWAGIMVDAVTGVTNLKESDIEPPSAIVSDTEAQLLSGIGKNDSQLILILDVYALFTLEERGKHKVLHPLLEAAL